MHTAQIAYAGNQYGVSFTYADKENPTFTRAVTDTKFGRLMVTTHLILKSYLLLVLVTNLLKVIFQV